MEKENVEVAFLFKNAINQMALLYAQSGLTSKFISNVTYKAGVYYVCITANNMTVIDSYVKSCNVKGVTFNRIDIDIPGFDAVYMFKE